MPFYVYVLHSKAYNKIYIGYTADLSARILSHNQLAKKGYTTKSDLGDCSLPNPMSQKIQPEKKKY
jgi:predicted GIY-YIG superfamily endonuclease